MASTISAATLTVTVTESITLNGSNMGATNTLSVASVNEVNQRIVSLDASNVRTLFEFGTTIGSGTFVMANVKYLSKMKGLSFNDRINLICKATSSE